MISNIVRSVCPYDCPDTCGLLVEVEDGRAVHVSGDPAHPVTRGLLCPKMNHYERTVHSPRRLTTPLMRTGPKGEGCFEPLSWDEAIERICSSLKDRIAGYGGECVLPYSYAGTMGLVQRNSGHPFFHKLGAPNVFGRASRCCSQKVSGGESSSPTNDGGRRPRRREGQRVPGRLKDDGVHVVTGMIAPVCGNNHLAPINSL